ncbi:MAG TPA: Uma2 family endonuclease [Pirellulales bacterium]
MSTASTPALLSTDSGDAASLSLPPANAAPTPRGPADAPPRPKRWTTDEYLRLAELGVFEGQKVELIAGEIVQHMSPQGEPHSATILLVSRFLYRAFGTDCCIRTQMPLSLAAGGMPEPDLAVVAGDPRDYTTAPTTALLAVEVSDSSLPYDRGAKASLYAAGGVADYWIVDLRNRRIEVRRNPLPDAGELFGFLYGTLITVAPGQTLAPLAAPNFAVDPAELLP